MKLPNGERAVVSDQKLFGYLLNPDHEEGRHHARLFKSLLGITESNGEVLRAALLDAACQGESILGKRSAYGQKYEIRLEMTGKRGRYTVLSVWFVPTGQHVPHLVTAYIV